MARHDDSSKKSKYPYCKKTESWCGHQSQWDDTPNNERTFTMHARGTYEETTKTGKKISYVVGDSQTYNKGGVCTTCDENSDSKTSGHSRSLTGGEEYSEGAGDKGGFSGGDVASVIMGANNTRCKSSYCGTDGDHNTNVGGNQNNKTKGQVAMNAAKISFNGAAGGASDERLKHDVQDIPDALETICKMRGVSFKWNDTKWLGNRKRHGVIAQEMLKVLPEVVDTDDVDGHYMVYYTELIGHLIEAVKELKREVDDLKANRTT